MSQRIHHKPGKVVVQMVVYPPSHLTQKPVLDGFLKGGSEDTLSVSSPAHESCDAQPAYTTLRALSVPV